MLDSQPGAFAEPGAELGASGMKFHGVRCGCGGSIFQAAGSPRHASGRGGHFIRTLRRVWQEAREQDAVDFVSAAPYLWPLSLRCEACGERGELAFPSLAPNPPAQADAAAAAPAPLESYRCRACRRGEMHLGLGVSGDEPTARSAVALVAHCSACRRHAILAGWDERPSPQEIELDRLYGRR